MDLQRTENKAGFFFCHHSSLTKLVHVATCCSGLFTYAAELWHGMSVTNVKADQQGRRGDGCAIVPGNGTEQSCRVRKHPTCSKGTCINVSKYIISSNQRHWPGKETTKNITMNPVSLQRWSQNNLIYLWASVSPTTSTSVLSKVICSLCIQTMQRSRFHIYKLYDTLTTRCKQTVSYFICPTKLKQKILTVFLRLKTLSFNRGQLYQHNDE